MITSHQRFAAVLLVTMSQAVSHVLCPADDAHGPQYQLHSPIEWIPVPAAADEFYMAQRSADGKLLLTPNESFFPKLGLRAEGTGTVPDGDRKLNGGNSFNTITRWNQGDQAEWGLWIEEPGELTVHVRMSQTDPKSRFTLSLGNHQSTFSVRETSKEPRRVTTPSIPIEKPGRYSLIVTCEQSHGSKAQLHSIELGGPAALNSAVLRKRWRPAAAHTRFKSSQSLNNVRLWIIEMDAKPGDLGFYSPITTPFGYYGPTWLASGIVNTGFNFSLWSYRRGQAEPPIERLSHLIAIGDPTATFGGFGHEGTGVKIRDWQPLEGRQGQRQAIALRVEPGVKYDTYFSYFFAADEQRWRLFGIGKKYNQGRPLKTLTVGSFVEVPGPPPTQRTGAYERQMRYRGWTVDANGNINPLDRMTRGDIDRSSEMTYTRRGVTPNGWFYLQTGGWTFRKVRSDRDVSTPRTRVATNVTYLDPEDLAFLQSVPCEIGDAALRKTAAGLAVTFAIQNLGKSPQVEIHWGKTDGLTFADRWESKAIVRNPQEGKNEFVIKDLPAGKPAFVRLFLKNQEGQFWSMETFKTLAR